MEQDSPQVYRSDTIFALASAPGRAGVAVVRVSGSSVPVTISALTKGKPISERNASVRTLFDPVTSDVIDQGLVVFFRAPHSYSGEDVVEFHIHGGRAVLSALTEALSRLPRLRPAEPGEFTRRAVENGRLDLTRAEAIADLIDSETDYQRRSALQQYDGRLATLYEGWRSRLIRAAAWIEAELDFPDEDLPENAGRDARGTLSDLLAEIRAHLADGRRGEIRREGVRVVIVGPVNAGKSSLLNALTQRDVAIVSAVPGTTRDVIEARLDLGGYAVILADTAGVRNSEDEVEREGVRRAQARADAADLRILLLDGSRPSVGADLATKLRPGDLRVWNKADIVADRDKEGLWISTKTGEGLTGLLAELERRAGDLAALGEAPVLTRARHRHALGVAVASLDQACASHAPEIAAEHLRQALRAIGRITGRVDLDELLDVVFRDFCIGK